MIRYALASALVLTSLTGCSTIRDVVVPGEPTPPAQMVTLQGNVTYRERMALPQDARVSVRIEDVSRADAPSITVASTNFVAGGRQVPLPFQISYDASQLVDGHRYTVSARIESADGQLLWITDTVNELPRYGRSIDLTLVRTR